jgi:leader peptidase (prepilin peptidase) / N-methyltransferase
VIAGHSLSLVSPARRFVAFGIATGIGAGMVWRFGWSAVLPAYLMLAALSGIVVVTDATEHRIPTKVVLPAYPIGAGLLALACAAGGTWWPLVRAGGTAGIVGGAYLLLGLLFPGQLGLGDVRLGGLLGGYLGFLGWSYGVTGALLGWAFGACFVVVGRGVPHRGVRLPFGPFLVAGALAVIFTSR